MMARLVTNILLLFMINVIHGDPLIIQIKQIVNQNNCPCNGCCDPPHATQPAPTSALTATPVIHTTTAATTPPTLPTTTTVPTITTKLTANIVTTTATPTTTKLTTTTTTTLSSKVPTTMTTTTTTTMIPNITTTTAATTTTTTRLPNSANTVFPGCKFGDTTYKHGALLPYFCTRFVCRNGKMEYDGYINEGCHMCKTYLDPHIVTYAQQYSSYSYQGCGNYSLSQIGNSYHPTVAVYATFGPCGGSSSVTCVDIVTFKNDEHTIITIEYKDDENKIHVNGEVYTVPSLSPSVVQVNDTVYLVLAWISGYNCLNLLGSSGMLVRFCGSSWANQVYAWAEPGITEYLEGLCGTTNDKNFRTRDGSMTWPWERNPPLAFPSSWLASNTSIGSCGSTNVQNRCEMDATVLNEIQIRCNSTIMNGISNAEPEEAQTIIDDCVFDMCRVSDSDGWIVSVEQTVQVQAEIQENTINITFATIASTLLPRSLTTSFPTQQSNPPTSQPQMPTSLTDPIATTYDQTTTEELTTMDVPTTTAIIFTDTGNCTLSGQSYESGTIFQKNCMRFYCENTKWYSYNQYNYLCGECSFNNDPHFTTFDNIHFDWHGHSTYVISNEGCEDCPETFVHSLFEDCVYGLAWATCVHTVYFQPEPNTYIQIVKGNPISNSQIIIDGFTQNLTSSLDGELTVLRGDNGTEHPAFAWMKSGCIHIMGFKAEGYLVKVSSWGASVFAYPTMKNNTCGLCGNWDDDQSNDLRFRSGAYTDPPSQTWTGWTDMLVDPKYGNDWKVLDCDENGTVILPDIPLTTPVPVHENPCNATDEEKNNFYESCKGLNNDVPKNLIAECVFDQCIVARSGNKTLAAEWLDKANSTIEEVKQQLNDTMEYPQDPITTTYGQTSTEGLPTTDGPTTTNGPTTTDVPATTTDILTSTDRLYYSGDYNYTNYDDYNYDDYDDYKYDDYDYYNYDTENNCTPSNIFVANRTGFAFFNCPKTFFQARLHCKQNNWSLAVPNEEFDEFNDQMPDGGEFWVDVQPELAQGGNDSMAMVWFWQSSPIQQEVTSEQWQDGYIHEVFPYYGQNCASLVQYDGLLEYDCDKEWYFACESTDFLMVPHKHVLDDMAFPKRVGPGRKL